MRRASYLASLAGLSLTLAAALPAGAQASDGGGWRISGGGSGGELPAANWSAALPAPDRAPRPDPGMAGRDGGSAAGIHEPYGLQNDRQIELVDTGSTRGRGWLRPRRRSGNRAAPR